MKVLPVWFKQKLYFYSAVSSVKKVHKMHLLCILTIYYATGINCPFLGICLYSSAKILIKKLK